MALAAACCPAYAALPARPARTRCIAAGPPLASRPSLRNPQRSLAMPPKRKAAATTAAASASSDITRIKTDDPRMSQIVIHNGTVYLSGQVAIIDKLEESDITEQTKQVLAKVDALLAEAGTDKSRLLSAQVWVKDIDEHFAAMNAVWNAWLDPDNKPARACVAAPMARPTILVEVMAVAAL